MSNSTGWNFANVWEAACDVIPDRIALVHGSRTLTWDEWDRRADSLAAALTGRGLRPDDKVAVALFNGPEFLESYYAAFKASFVPVNTNYRYQVDELVYLWDNADAAAVIYDETLVDRVAKARPQLPQVKVWISLGASSDKLPAWAEDYNQLVLVDSDRAERRIRSGNEPFLLYTGGTTGMPKGVIWRQDDFFTASHRVKWSPEEFARRTHTVLDAERPVALPAAPLMHGTALAIAWNALDDGGSVVTLPGQKFQAAAVIDAIRRHRVTTLGIVGDAFAKPLIDAIEAMDEPPDLSSLRYLMSSGAMWSRENKERLLAAAPGVRLVDMLGASEAMGVGRSVMSSTVGAETAEFKLREGVTVVSDDGEEVKPGSGEIGRIAMSGPTSIGYYKDDVKTAATFIVRAGKRLALTGDYAQVDAEGRIRFIGRGNMCINTGGEKVFPEEVEEVLKALDGVRDAAVVGVPDERFGETICAVVDCSVSIDDDQLIGNVKARLAGYKAPRLILRGEVQRLVNGKVDYQAVKDWVKSKSETAKNSGVRNSSLSSPDGLNPPLHVPTPASLDVSTTSRSNSSGDR